MDLSDDSRQWDYTDPAQRILIAERCRAMLDALAEATPHWTAAYAASEQPALQYASFTNARVEVERALRYMREQPASTEQRDLYPCGRNAGPRDMGDPMPESTATAAHACQACGRHPDTHHVGGVDTETCGACGLGDEK